MGEQPKEHYQYLRGLSVCTDEDCAYCKDKDFLQWLDGVIKSLIHDYNWPVGSALSIDDDAWRDFFDEGLSVQEAIYEELTSG